MPLSPEKLTFTLNGGTKTIAVESYYTGEGTWEIVDIYPANSKITTQLANQTSTSCDVIVTVDPYTAADANEYTCYLNQNAAPARPFSFSFPIELTSYNSGFTPNSETIVAPYSGASYTVVYRNSTNNVVDWSIYQVENGTVSDIVKTDDTLQFTLTTVNNAGDKVLPGYVKIDKKLTGNAIERITYNFNISPMPELVFNPAPPLTFEAEGGTATVNVMANEVGETYSIVTAQSMPAWFLADISQDGKNATITVTATEYSSKAEPRRGNIEVTYGSYKADYDVIQNPIPKIIGTIEILNPIFNISFFPYEGIANIKLTNISSPTVVSNVDWITCELGNNNSEVKFAVDGNNTFEDRKGIIAVIGLDPQDETVSSTISITQKAYNIAPIAQDIYFNYDTIDMYIDYTLNIDDKIVYSGRAYKLPDANYIKFNINKLAAPYLSNTLPAAFPYKGYESNIYMLNDYFKSVSIKDADKNTLFEFSFFDDWGYDFRSILTRGDRYGNLVLSSPVKKIIDRRQYFFYSFFKANEMTYDFNYTLKNSKTGESVVRMTKEMTDRTHYLVMDNDLISMPQYDLIDINGDIYKIIDSCCEYALYYKNAYGGWDSLLIEGNNLKSDSITSNSYVKGFDNNTVQFESKKYLNVISPNYTFYTDYLTDDEAGRMWHLIGSTEVYLHNLRTNEIKPANITDKNCDYKTFSNQGRKKFYYTIKLEIAQEKLRK